MAMPSPTHPITLSRMTEEQRRALEQSWLSCDESHSHQDNGDTHNHSPTSCDSNRSHVDYASPADGVLSRLHITDSAGLLQATPDCHDTTLHSTNDSSGLSRSHMDSAGLVKLTDGLLQANPDSPNLSQSNDDSGGQERSHVDSYGLSQSNDDSGGQDRSHVDSHGLSQSNDDSDGLNQSQITNSSDLLQSSDNSGGSENDSPRPLRLSSQLDNDFHHSGIGPATHSDISPVTHSDISPVTHSVRVFNSVFDSSAITHNSREEASVYDNVAVSAVTNSALKTIIEAEEGEQDRDDNTAEIRPNSTLKVLNHAIEVYM